MFTRRPKDNPLGKAMTPEEIIHATHLQDMEIKLHGYAKLGVSDKTIDRLRTLDGMAKTAGEWLSTSVQTAYQLFSVQQIHLFEETESIREEMANKSLSKKERLELRRLFLDYVRELGRGHNAQFVAASALAQMALAASGRAERNEKTVKPKRSRGRIRPSFTEVEATPGE